MFFNKQLNIEGKGAKIGLIRFSSLGDVILTFPLIAAIHRKLPGSQIYFITKECYAPLFENNSLINDVLVLPEKKDNQGSPLKELKNAIRNEHFDLLIDLHSNIRSRILCFFGSADRILRYKKGSLQRRLLAWTGLLLSQAKRVSERYFEPLKGLDIGYENEPPKLPLSETEMKESHQSLNSFLSKSQGVLIGLGPGARHTTKMWPVDRFSKLVELIKTSLPSLRGILIFGDQSEKLLGETLFDQHPDVVVNLTGKLALRETAAYMSHCDITVTNDTGLMHLSTAVNTPVVAIFGPTTREFGFFPMGQNNMIVEKDLICRPCTIHGSSRCPIATFECMTSIGPDDVLSSMSELLELKQARTKVLY